MNDSPKTMGVPEAGRIYLGIGRDASYEAAKRGDIPIIRIGKLMRVPVILMERMMEQAGASK
jgi:excisionase family DNA binding protein